MNVPGTLLVSDDFVKLIDVVGDVATLCVTCGVSESVRDRSTSVRISLSSLERSAPELLRASRAGVSSVDAVSRPSPKLSLVSRVAPTTSVLNVLKSVQPKLSPVPAMSPQSLFSASELTVVVPVVSVVKRSSVSSELEVKDVVSLVRRSPNVFVKIELFDSKTNLSVDSFSGEVDLNKLLDEFFIPSSPPVLNVARSAGSSFATLEIKQVDPKATSVIVFRRLVHPDVNVTLGYESFGKLSLTKEDGPSFLRVEARKSVSSLFQVVSLGRLGAMSMSFSSIVVPPARHQKKRAASVVLAHDGDTVTVRVSAFHEDVVFIELLKRDRTVFDRVFARAGSGIAAKDTKAVTFIDRDIKNTHVYEYAARLTFRDGLSSVTGNSLLKFLKRSTKGDVVKVIDVSLRKTDNKNADVTIELEAADQEVEHVLRRSNVVTGDVEEAEGFRGSKIRDVIKDDGLGNLEPWSYQYDIVSLQQLKELSEGKEIVDVRSGKRSKINEKKFLRRDTLLRGVVPGGKTFNEEKAVSVLQVNHVDVSLDDEIVSIDDLDVVRRDGVNVLSWSVVGDSRLIDHFLVNALTRDSRFLVGVTHARSETFGFSHQTDNTDVVGYEVSPVLIMSSVGRSAEVKLREKKKARR